MEFEDGEDMKLSAADMLNDANMDKFMRGIYSVLSDGTQTYEETIGRQDFEEVKRALIAGIKAVFGEE